MTSTSPAPTWKPRKGKALVMRTTDADGKAYRGFQWPSSGAVEAPDWKPSQECGNGLHGLLWGSGDGNLLDWSEDALWYAVEVNVSDVIDLDGKVKFPRGTVVHCGTRLDVVTLIAKHAPAGTAVVAGTATAGDVGTATAGYWGTATAGDWGTATAGYWGTATAGDWGTATAGDWGTATAGHGGTATAGDWGTATAGYGGTATAGDRGTATAGDRGTATAGDVGTATAGDRGTATAGDRGTATAGDRGTATAGDRGTATAGHGGTATAGDLGTATAGYGGLIVITWWDASIGRYRKAVGEVGVDGIEPHVAYRVADGQLTQVARDPAVS